jgi:hypothetical protein
MKTQYQTAPPFFERLQGGILINFNIKEIERGFECDQVKVSETPTRSEIIAALIRANYSADDELAIIHNGTDTPAHAQELADFNDYRAAVKAIATEVLNNL